MTLHTAVISSNVLLRMEFRQTNFYHQLHPRFKRDGELQFSLFTMLMENNISKGVFAIFTLIIKLQETW